MVRPLLIRGMLVGLAAGVLAFAFAYVFGEPQIQRAIDFEDALARSTGAPVASEVVGRGVQSTLGLLAGTVALGVALGGGFSVVYAYVYGRIGAAGPRATAAVLAAAAFVTITLVPFTKYPANPPAVSDPATIGQRTLLYAAMIAITVAALVAGSRVRSQLLTRLGSWNASLVAGGVFIGLVAVAQLILPAIQETPRGFPADVLYRFRLASLGISAVLWLSIGLGFGAAAERLLSRRERRVAVPAGEAA